ncbi:hypothetical protein TYRP_017129 [Tyrophagus putrescentiae]|nr:hypothetical protein TYRP_017129 [Tyrophagus putrescentiae]
MLTAPLTQWTKSRARCLPLAEKIEFGGVGHQHRTMLNDYKIIQWRRPKEPSNARNSLYKGH